VSSVSDVGYGAEEGALKNFGTKADGFGETANERVLERVAIPLGDNEDYYLSATLREDTEQSQGELRGVPGNGQRITLAAYNTSNVLVGSANYYYSTSVNDLVPQTAGAPLLVDVDNSYYIVAYSYNSTTENPGTSNIDPSKDLLWGKSGTKYITLSDRAVTITMAHLFSRLKVNISSTNTGGNITSIGTVKIAGGKLAGLNLATGVVTAGSAVADATIVVTGSNATRESGYRVFYPSPTKVTISAVTVTVGNTPHSYSNLSADFTKTLEAGKSYVLSVDLARANWAYSNIYWDGSKLTFDKYPVSPTREDYQGVYFKWGSLIGVEPASSGTNHRLFIPNVTNKTWDGSKYVNTTHSLWPDAQYGWAAIPSGSGVPNNGVIYDYPAFSSYRGDICSYLTNGAWRMPARTELEEGSYGSAFATLSGGSTSLKGVIYTTSYRPVFFPASGYIEMQYAFRDLGKVGIYWSGSNYLGNLSAHALYIGDDGSSGGGRVDNNVMSANGFPVRCIKI
jgi:hypothetical protein